MPWDLAIHHIYVGQGDATLIVATWTPPPMSVAPNIVRALLIDGGKGHAAAGLHAYITTTAGLVQLDVMAATHYENDHYGGLTGLLELGGTVAYDNVIIYDQGEPPDSVAVSRRRNLLGAVVPNDYMKYIAAIAAKPNVVRATHNVNAFNIVRYDNADNPIIPRPNIANNNGGNYSPPDWLIGKEILWGNGSDEIAPHPAFAPVPPAQPNPPTVTCIAANKYVAQNGGGTRFVTNIDIYNGPNRMANGLISDLNLDGNQQCLGFLVQFNNFKYYLGGDLETIQEDGFQNPRGNLAFMEGVMQRTNNPNDFPNRVHGFKASHHGSGTSSSRQFIDRLRPRAVFISAGLNNQHGLPHQRVLTDLDAAFTANNEVVENYYLTSNGNTVIGPGGILVGTAPGVNGDIVIRVTEAQSQTATGIPAPPNSNSTPFTVTYQDVNGVQNNAH